MLIQQKVGDQFKQNVFADGRIIFILATGGTETTCGDFKIHTFTGPGTFV